MFIGKIVGKILTPGTKIVKAANKTALVTYMGAKGAQFTAASKIDKICEKSSIANRIRGLLKRCLAPIGNIKATYSENKHLGKLKALKAVLSKNGYGGPIGAVCGYGFGWATYPFVPGSGTLCATLGYGVGRGVEVLAKKTINFIA